jgi:UDP-2,3-diacylglucosamine hydrolase
MVSDVHLGAPDHARSLQRERRLVAWLDRVATDAQEIYLLGDLFDFWFEWRHVVPKGYVRLLGKLAELSDRGIPITALSGNHDVWYYDYFPTELGIPVYRDPIIRTFFGQQFYIAHGDALGPGDRGYKLLKAALRNPLLQWAFARLHPNLAIRIAHWSSNTSRNAQERRHKLKDYGEKEMQVQFARQYSTQHPQIAHLVMGHRHLARHLALNDHCSLWVLGDWIEDFSYLEISEHGVCMRVDQPDAD